MAFEERLGEAPTWRRSELTSPPCNEACAIGQAPPEKQRALCALRALLLDRIGLPPVQDWQRIAEEAHGSHSTPHHTAGMVALRLAGDDETAALAHQCAAKAATCDCTLSLDIAYIQARYCEE